MKKKNNRIIILTVSVFIGIVFSISIKQSPDNHSIISLSSVEGLRDDIELLEKELRNTQDSLEERKERLSELENLSTQDDKSRVEDLENRIEEVRNIAGFTELEGPGIELVLADNTSEEVIGENINDDIIHDSDIQILINDLKRAGAEAISINEQRVLSKSEIKCGGPVIKINQRSSANPFIVKAIGNPDTLYSAIEGDGRYGDMLKDVYKIKVSTTKKESIKVPAYQSDIIDYKYIETKEEG